MEVFDSSGKSLFEAKPKKKKKYILFLYSMKREDAEKIKAMEREIQNTLKDYILVRFEDANEGLKALIVKNIEIIVIDSSLFEDDEISVEYAVECKKRKKCPILFIAKYPNKLIEEYRQKLFTYEEFDSYFTQPLEITDFKKKLQQISKSNKRISKRFPINIPVSLYRLNNDTHYLLNLIDISLVGFGVLYSQKELFSINEQVQIKIPLAAFKIFHKQYGEFLPISGKLRRISINGENLGFSIEFITPLQAEILCEIFSIVNYRAKMLRFPEKPKEIQPKKTFDLP